MPNEEKIEFDVLLDINHQAQKNDVAKEHRKLLKSRLERLEQSLPILEEIIEFYIKYDQESLKEFMVTRLTEWFISNPKNASKVIEEEYNSIIDYMIDKDYETQNSLSSKGK